MVNSLVVISGDRLCLRPFQKDDLIAVISWRNNVELQDNVLWMRKPFAAAEAEQWLKAISKENSEAITFAIELKDNKRIIGQTNFSRIDYDSGTAFFGIVIGERDFWGQGIAKETISLMLSYAATDLKLRKILLEVVDYNQRAIKLYEKLGFQVEGILRRQTFRKGEHHDVLVMALFLSN